MYRVVPLIRICVALMAVLAAILLPPTVTPSRAANLHKITLWLDWYPNSDHAGIYVAMAKGYYTQAGLQVNPQVPSGAADAVALVTHGTGDIGISYEPTVLLARAQGVPVTAAAAIIQRPLNCVLALRSTGITRPRDLMGHTVGVAGDPADYTDLRALMAHDGGDYNKVKIVNVGYNLLQAFLSHRVDAIIGGYWTWEALQATEQGVPVNVMRLDQFGIPTYNELVFVTGPSQLSSESGYLRAFLRATFQGYAYAAAHPAEATSILLKVKGVLSTSRGLIQHSITLLAPLFKGPGGRYGTIDTAQWQAYANWMTAGHLLPKHLDVTQIVTQSLLH